jgi:hypothetical protein
MKADEARQFGAHGGTKSVNARGWSDDGSSLSHDDAALSLNGRRDVVMFVALQGPRIQEGAHLGVSKLHGVV